MEKIQEYSEHEGSTAEEDDSEERGPAKIEIASKQNKAVRGVRYAVALVLLLAAAVVSLSVFYYTRSEEITTFDQHFMDQGTKVVDTFSQNAERRLEALQAFSQQITSYALHSNSTWPFVTLPDFERHAVYTLKLAEVVALLTFPIITAETRAEWQTYSVANQGWLAEGLSIQQAIEDEETLNFLQGQFEKGNVTEERTVLEARTRITPVVYKVAPGTTQAEPEDGPGPYAPIWQIAPAIPVGVMINFNSLSHPARTRELTSLIQSEKMMISSAADFRDEDPLTANRKSVMGLFLDRWQNGTYEYEDGPVSDSYIPIYDNYGPDKKMVSVLTAYVYWQSYFSNVLPDGENGIVAILENDCGQAYTYMLYGREAVYIGQGDLHDTEFDHLMVETGFGAFLKQDISEHKLDAQCFYNVRVYPSDEMRDEYVTIAPIVFAAALAAVFLFTSLVFLTYDRLVARRHTVVNTQAVQSTAVVSSLFPEKVRERLYETSAGAKTTGKTRKEKAAFLSNHASSYTDESMMVDDSMPIADLYPECTVLFADISGFTAWASMHTPAEVFKLLETLYAAFDKIARKRRVFKVETIGDCYVAVTGLPNPQDSHAVIMTRFASECLLAVHPVLHSLVDKLGPETLNLGMRVGINSGPVTAGVLRGEKARFQLFGDTVNTAARMESCGQMGRVHVSESTATLLQSAGKAGWVTRREDLVEAKGKGSLQTYWIAPEVDFSATVKDTQSDTLSLSRGGSSHGKSRGRSSSLQSSTETRSEDEVLMQRAVGRLVKQSSARLTAPMQSDDGMIE